MSYPPGMAEHLRLIWDEMAAILNPDTPAPDLEALCGQVRIMREAETRVMEEGPIVTDGKGNAVPHPGILIARQAGEEIRKWTGKHARRTF
jgi:hypothetical protein